MVETSQADHLRKLSRHNRSNCRGVMQGSHASVPCRTWVCDSVLVLCVSQAVGIRLLNWHAVERTAACVALTMKIDPWPTRRAHDKQEQYQCCFSTLLQHSQYVHAANCAQPRPMACGHSVIPDTGGRLSRYPPSPAFQSGYDTTAAHHPGHVSPATAPTTSSAASSDSVSMACTRRG